MASTSRGEEVADGVLEERFKRAAERMRQNTALVLNNDSKLKLYGLFKQVCLKQQREYVKQGMN